MARIILILTLFSISTCYASFSWQLPAYSAEITSRASLRCIISSQPSPPHQLDIYFKGKKLATGGNYDVIRSDTEVDLRIKNIDVAHGGNYECRDATTSQVDKTMLMIRANFPDDTKTFHKTIGTKAVVPFKVISYPRPDITYNKENAVGAKTKVAEISSGGTMKFGADRYTIDTNTGELTILTVQPVDGGKYEVESLHAGSLKSGTFTLVVGDEPKIKTPPAPMYNLVSGMSKTIKCEFEKAPDSIIWEYTAKGKAKVTITASSPSNGLSLEGTHLKIASVSINNQGATMACIGTNKFGSVTANSKIGIVYVKPSITPLKNAEVNKDAAKELACVASGNPPPVVTWYKMKGDKFAKLIGQKMEAGNSTYKIEKADLNDGGTYQCKAVLADMTSLNDTATMTIAILTKPVFDMAGSSTSETYAVGKNQSKDLKCAASGNPAPKIKFMKGVQELSGAVEKKDGNKVTMTLKHVANATSDAGTVTCVAVNSVGSSEHNITIQIIDVPTAPTGLKATTVERTYVELTWDLVAGATEYKIKIFGRDIKAASINSAKIEGLEGGKAYKFSVAAVNAAGIGTYSPLIDVTTQKFDKPSVVQVATPPTNFKKNDITVSWEKPVNDGGDPALTYRVKYCQLKGGKQEDCKTVATNKTSVDLKGLAENTDYSFTITATNQRGGGDDLSFNARVGSSKAPATTKKPTKITPKVEPKPGPQKGLSGGAIAGIIIAVVLILLFVIDLFCCFFNDCGFSYCCYHSCCAPKGKGKDAGAPEDPEKAELAEMKESGNDHQPETKTVPEEKEALTKEKKTEDV